MVEMVVGGDGGGMQQRATGRRNVPAEPAPDPAGSNKAQNLSVD